MSKHYHDHKDYALNSKQDTINSNLQDIETDTDAMVSKLTDMTEHTTLIASRSNNIQNKLSQNTDGTGLTIGENTNTIKDYLFTMRGGQANLLNAVSCGTSGQTSSIVDWFTAGVVPKKVSIIVTATSSVSATGFEVYISADNSTYAPIMINGSKTFQLNNSDTAGNSMNTAGGVIINNTMRYMKIIVYSATATYTATAIGLA